MHAKNKIYILIIFREKLPPMKLGDYIIKAVLVFFFLFSKKTPTTKLAQNLKVWYS